MDTFLVLYVFCCPQTLPKLEKEVFDWEQKYKSLTAEQVIIFLYIFYCPQTLPKLEKEVFDWEQKYKSLTAIDELKNKVKQLKNELAWAWVIEKEKVQIYNCL